jgi:nucleotide-binding universal stress UspA family protein
MNFRKILVAVDGSVPSSAALDFALGRARVHGSELVIAYAFDRGAIAARACGPYGSIDAAPLVRAVEEEANAVLASASARAAQANIQSRSILLDGPATSQLLKCAREQSVDAIVVGTHGRSGLSRLAFGSVAEGVLRASGVPTFVIPEDTMVAVALRSNLVGAALRSILVAADGSDASVDATRYGLEVAAAERAEIVFCSVVDPNVERWSRTDYGYDPDYFIAEMKREAATLLEHLLENARIHEVPARALLRCGKACDEILAAADDVASDLVVVGTHARTGLGRFFLGSVAESVLRRSVVPVCTIAPIPREWHGAGQENRQAVGVG